MEAPDTIAEINGLPIKTQNGATTYIRDVAHVRDGFSPQTNIVRQNGIRGTLITVMRNGGASTLDIVRDLKDVLKRVAPTLPDGVDMKLLFDQSLFVRASISGVVREAMIAACLTAAMILLFLGNWRSTHYYCHLHSAIDSLFGHQPCRPGRDLQHHDPGRAGAGRRYPCG